MPPAKMHADEVDVDAELVRRLIADQHPDLAKLPISRVRSAGTVNAIFRLGDDLAVRLPLVRSGATEQELTSTWVPKLVPNLPLDCPETVATGVAAFGYPYTWSIERWLEGENPDAKLDLAQAAVDLGEFVVALQHIPAGDAPRSSRGGPLLARDRGTRSAITELENDYDTSELTRAWDFALSLGAWEGPPTWYHGDLMPGNLLVRDGRLSAVIDWGCLGAGDPACDLMVAWTVLDAASRPAFRSIVGTDEASWERGRGWALTCGIMAMPYYRETNPAFSAVAKRMIDEAL